MSSSSNWPQLVFCQERDRRCELWIKGGIQSCASASPTCSYTRNSLPLMRCSSRRAVAHQSIRNADRVGAEPVYQPSE